VIKSKKLFDIFPSTYGLKTLEGEGELKTISIIFVLVVPMGAAILALAIVVRMAVLRYRKRLSSERQSSFATAVPAAIKT
jgi:hypothetical protein